MNRFHSRECEKIIQACLGVLPVVIVTGARQTGKTTLVTNLLKGQKRKYYTLDQFDIMQQAKTSPDSLLEVLPITIDEVQRAPELLLAIKKNVDAKRVKGSILLTGSANLLLLKNVSETLAGRAIYLELPPFCPIEWVGVLKVDSLFGTLFQEKMDLSAWQIGKYDWIEWALTGGYPSAIELENSEERKIWFAGYVQTYLERDLRQISEVASLVDFQRVMVLAANRLGKLVNETEIARDAGVSQPTCHRYLNLLETGYQIVRLQNYDPSLNKSLIKGKKLYWTDVGLAAYLARIYDRESLLNKIDMGSWLEQSVFQTLQSWRNLGLNRSIYYWRSSTKNEVDFIITDKEQVVAIEVKASENVYPVDLKQLRLFQEKHSKKGKKVRAIVLYSGKEARSLGDNAYALPLGVLFPK